MDYASRRILYFLIVLITFTSLASANLDWEKGKYNLEYASENANQIYTAKLVNLSDEDSIVEPDDIGFYPDNFELGDRLNYDNGVSGRINYSSSLGLWYASFPQYRSSLQFEYSNSDSEDIDEKILEFSRIAGGLSSEFTRLEDHYAAGQSEVDVGANIEFDDSNNINNVFLRIYNGSETFLYKESGYSEEENYYFLDLKMPSGNGEYIFQISAEGYENIESADSTLEFENNIRGVNSFNGNEFFVAFEENITRIGPDSVLNYTGHENESGIKDMDKFPQESKIASTGGSYVHVWDYDSSGEKNESEKNYTGHSGTISNVVVKNSTSVISSADSDIHQWSINGGSGDGKISSQLNTYSFGPQINEIVKYRDLILVGLESGEIYELNSEFSQSEIHENEEENKGLHNSVKDIEIFDSGLILSKGSDENHIWNISEPSEILMNFTEGTSSGGFTTSFSFRDEMVATHDAGDDNIRIWSIKPQEGKMENVLNYTGTTDSISLLEGSELPGIVSMARGKNLEIFDIQDYIERGGTSKIVKIRPDSTGSIFNINDSLSFNVDKIDSVNRSFNVSSKQERPMEIGYDLDDNLSDVFRGFDNDTLVAEENLMKNVTINLTNYSDINGQLNVTANVTDKIKMVDVEITTLDCDLLENHICVGSSAIQFDRTDDTITKTLEVNNLENKENKFSFSVYGNISDHIQINDSFSVNNSRDIPVIYEPVGPGNHTGNLTINSSGTSINISLEGESNASERDIDLGITPEVATPLLVEDKNWTDTSINLTVENTGTVNLEKINVTSPSKDLNIEDFNLDKDEIRDVKIPVSQQDGDFTLIFNVTGRNTTFESEVEPETIENVNQEIGDLQDRINNLRTRTNSSEIQTQLSQIETGKLSTIETEWTDNQNYREAEQTYEDVLAELDNIEEEINSNETPNEDPGSDPEPEPPGNSGGGGGLIMIILIVMLLLGVGGFVFYESYIPEEGDPLYGVMGE
jgi:hypothetical protein